MTTPKHTPGEWIEWNGGECPVEPETMVEILFRHEKKYPEDYQEGTLPAADVAWTRGRHRHDLDVVAYRVVQS